MSAKQQPALAGLRVLDLGTFIAAPYAATILSEFGAEVIKIEKPNAGDPLREFGTPTASGSSLCWKSEARNKKSVTLDLSDRRGAELLKSLVAESDIVCESFRPGTMERWGLGFSELSAVNPKLIMLRVSGFGQSGPLKSNPGFARIAHAFGGLAHQTGMPGEAPLTPGSTSLADYMTGLFGAIGILVALQARDTVGGQEIDLALYESVFRVLDDLAPTYAYNGEIRGRLGVGTSNACPHGHFQCADQQWLALACSSDKMFKRFAGLMQRPELADIHRLGTVKSRLENRVEVDRITAEWFASIGSEEALSRCAEAGVPCSAVQTIADIFEHEHVQARQNLQTVQQGDDHYVLPNVVPKLSKTPGRIDSVGPDLGLDTERVLGDIAGLSAEQLSALRDANII